MEAVVGNITLQGATGELPVGEATSPTVAVDELQYDKARQIVEEYEAMMQKGGDVADITDIEGQFDWPICPVCDELREMTCIKCNYSGSEFVESTQGSPDEHAAAIPMMMCRQCEATSPLALHSICRFCKHDFTVDEDPDQLRSEIPTDGNTGKILFLIALIIFLFVAFLLWFEYAT